MLWCAMVNAAPSKWRSSLAATSRRFQLTARRRARPICCAIDAASSSVPTGLCRRRSELHAAEGAAEGEAIGAAIVEPVIEVEGVAEIVAEGVAEIEAEIEAEIAAGVALVVHREALEPLAKVRARLPHLPGEDAAPRLGLALSLAVRLAVRLSLRLPW